MDLPLVVIDLPLSVKFKNGYEIVTFKLNLNVYGTKHHAIRAKAKKAYSRLLIKPLSKIKAIGEGPFVFTYRYWHPTKGRFDVANPCCIIDKFATDAIVDAKILTDDSYKEIREVKYIAAGISRDNPRCELSITRFIAPPERAWSGEGIG